MQWLQTMGSIISAEVGIFLLLVLFIVYRFTTKTAEKDMDRVEDFLEKIDSESLIHISDLEQRAEDHRDTIKKNITTITHVKSILKDTVKQQPTEGVVSVVDDCLTSMSENYLKVIKAIEAIKQREIDHLKEQNDILTAKLEEVSDLLSDVTLECARVVMDEAARSEISRKRIMEAVSQLHEND